MSKKLNRVGEEYTTNTGYKFKIIEYKNNKDCSIEFFDGFKINNITFGQIKSGSIKYPFHNNILGIATTGFGKYNKTEDSITYGCWYNILQRTIKNKLKNIEPTYNDCKVVDEWLNFQNFAEWYYNNCLDYSFQIDKDILSNSKIYGPDTCCFVPNEINMLFLNYENYDKINEGVNKRSDNDKYRVQFQNVYLGQVDTLEAGRVLYQKEKNKTILKLAEKWKDKLIDSVYERLINIGNGNQKS